MKKQLLVISVAAAIAAPAAMADVTAYGRIHVSGDMETSKSTAATPVETSTTLPMMNSARSTSLGLKGSMDSEIPNAKIVFQGEIGIDGASYDAMAKDADGTGLAKSKAGAIWMRDAFAGISSSAFGTVRGGVMTHSYKETHAAVDPLMTTALEARGTMNMLSGASNGYGADKGSMTGSVRYDSPTFAGAKLIGQMSHDTTATNYVIGARYSMGPVSAFFDYLADGSVNDSTQTSGLGAGNAMIFAVKANMMGVGAAFAYEMDGGALSGTLNKKVSGTNYAATNNIMFFNVDYTMGAFKVIGSFSTKADSEVSTKPTNAKKDGSTSWRVAAVYAAAKGTDIYAGYGARSADATTNGGVKITTETGTSVSVSSYSMATVGMSVKF